MRRKLVEIAPSITRMCSARSKDGKEHSLRVMLDPGAAVTLISETTAQLLGLERLNSELPTLGWIQSERKSTYGAYALDMRLQDDNSVERMVHATAYGADMTGIEVLLGNYTLQTEDVQIDCGKQRWRWGITSADHVELVGLHEVLQGAEDPIVIGMVGISAGRAQAVHVFHSDATAAPRVPEALQEYADLFNPENAGVLPEMKETDHRIPLVEGKSPPHGPLYKLSERELEVLRVYLEDALRKGWIRHSTSPAGAPIMFVPKKGGKLRLCVDYRALNAVTIKDRCPLPLIEETLDRLTGARYFTSLDLKDAYHRIRISAGDEWKTAFRTRYGHFEYLVMPFGLTNAPATFQAYINRALAGLVDHLCVVYLDDILIYTHSDELEEHWRAVREVLARLQRAELYCNLEKCKFATDRVEFLGFIVGTDGVSADPERIRTITEWPVPKSIKDIQIFLGFANFYRRFIARYSIIVKDLTALLKGDAEFAWSKGAQTAFERIKTAFSTAPLLRFFDPTRVIRVEADASKDGVAALMTQQDDNGQWHPVAIVSKKLTEAERNWEVYDQELYAIVHAFKMWRHYLEGAKHTVQVITDHDNLRGMRAVSKLNGRQTRWTHFLSGFDFEIFHRPGVKNPADAPSRRPDYVVRSTCADETLPTLQRKLRLASQAPALAREASSEVGRVETESGERGAAVTRVIVESETLVEPCCNAGVAHLTPVADAAVCTQRVSRRDARILLIDANANAEGKRPLHVLVSELQEKDSFAQTKRASIEQGLRRTRSGDSRAWSNVDNLLRYHNKIYVPDEESLRKELLYQHHDDQLAGHFDADRTHELLARSYHWPNMMKDVQDYVRTCAICQRTKVPRAKPNGKLVSLPIPSDIFEEVSMDFITQLPPSKRGTCVYDAILVIVDRYSKMSLYICSSSTWQATDLADAIFENVVCKFGTPKGIVTDRGSLFTSAYWAQLMQALQVKRRLSTAYHPQTDGQTERQNQTLEHYLRAFVNEQQNDWASLLPMAEFAYNNSRHSSTGKTPFEIVFGRNARLPLAPEDVRLEGEVPAAMDRAERMRSARTSLEEHLRSAQETQARTYNKKHTHVTFQPGDHVLLSAKHLRLHLPSRKMTARFIGPFEVLSAVGTQAYRLRLPPTYRMHNVFHVSLLRRYLHRKDEPQDNVLAPELDDQGEEVWQIEKILARRRNQGRKEYLVKWEGWSNEWNQWEPMENLEGATEAIQEFEDETKLRGRETSQRKRT